MYIPFNGASQYQLYVLPSPPLSTLQTHNSHFQTTEALQAMNQRNYFLQLQIGQLKNFLQLQIGQLKTIMLQMQGEIEELKRQLLSENQTQTQRFEPIKDQQRQEQSKKVKFYAKDKHCTIEGCSKKYSSRIALNAHLRKVHRFFIRPPSFKFV